MQRDAARARAAGEEARARRRAAAAVLPADVVAARDADVDYRRRVREVMLDEPCAELEALGVKVWRARA